MRGLAAAIAGGRARGPLTATSLARLEAAAKPAGQAAVPAGGGGAWPGFEPTRRAKLVARTARGRAAAHGRTKQPGPTAGPSSARPHTPPQAPQEPLHGIAKGPASADPLRECPHSSMRDTLTPPTSEATTL